MVFLRLSRKMQGQKKFWTWPFPLNFPKSLFTNHPLFWCCIIW